MSVSIAAARRLRPTGPFHLSPGAQPIDTSVTLTVSDCPTAPQLRLTDTRTGATWQVAMHAYSGHPDAWQAELRLPVEPTILTYVLLVDGAEIQERRQIESRGTNEGNRPVYGEWEDLPFRIAVYDPDRMPADWTQGMMMYQIFPDRFARHQSEDDVKAHLRGVYGHEPLFKAWGELPEQPPLGRDFFGGDLKGIIERLDYLQDLGVECLYLNPIFEATANHRYEAIDFLKVDPMLGTDADFDQLIEEAHRRDMRVVLDAVFNHCSSDSRYFDVTGKYGDGASQSQESPYYRWFNFREWPHDYDGWAGHGFMPEFVECPEVEDFFNGPAGVTAHWLERGIDGWRCDVAYDNTDTFWRRFRARVDATRPGAYTVSEEWRDSTHYLLGDTFSATMNYRFTWAVRGFLATGELTASELDDRLNTWIRDTPQPALKAQMNLIDSHDTDRALHACGGDRDRLKQMVAFLLAYPGAPCLYYGTETALDGAFAEDGRRTFPWGETDEDMMAFVKRAMQFRKSSQALRHGETDTLLIDDARRVYVFARRSGHRVVYVAFNGGDEPATVSVQVPEHEQGRYTDALETHPPVEAFGEHVNAELHPRGVAWYVRV